MEQNISYEAALEGFDGATVTERHPSLPGKCKARVKLSKSKFNATKVPGKINTSVTFEFDVRASETHPEVVGMRCRHTTNGLHNGAQNQSFMMGMLKAKIVSILGLNKEQVAELNGEAKGWTQLIKHMCENGVGEGNEFLVQTEEVRNVGAQNEFVPTAFFPA